jgi:molecular chaperone GrpE
MNDNDTPERDEDAAPQLEPIEAPDTGAAEAAGPADRVAALEAEVADLKDRLLRALAETENVRRRAAKEREDTAKYATAAFARDVVKVADNLHRALESASEAEKRGGASDALIEGVRLTERELLAALERHGIKRIDPKGEKFSHELHEAMFEIPTADHEPGTILQVMEPGYVIHDRLLRPARVGVAKAPSGGAREAHLDTTV